MSALPGIIGLLIVIYVRPHEFFKELKDYNLLYVFMALSAIGMLHDISERRTRLMVSPMLPWVGLLTLDCAIGLAIRRPDIVSQKIIVILMGGILFFVIGHGVQTLNGFMKICGAIFLIGLFVAYVGADQGLSGFQCHNFNPAEKNGRGYTDGRPCEMFETDGTPHDGTMDCIVTGRPGVAYTCERAGLFGTSSIGGGRVRYLGVLLDPNEVALATAMVIPFAFAFLEARATVFRLATLIGSIVLVAIEIVYTGSRGGQVAFGAVLGAYFVKKYGWKKGAIAGAAMAAPMVLLGGRKGDEADESTLERLGCAAAGIKMLMTYPLTGVGYLQYTEYHFLTAHNAYILAAGELGLPGIWLFGLILFLSIKIPLAVLRFDMVESYDSRRIKAMAMGLLALFCGMLIGIFFLSWTYHYVLWIHFGVVTALWSVTKRMYPTFDCKVTWKEARAVILAYVAFLIVWSGYIKHKGAWDH